MVNRDLKTLNNDLRAIPYGAVLPYVYDEHIYGNNNLSFSTCTVIFSYKGHWTVYCHIYTIHNATVRSFYAITVYKSAIFIE